MIKHSIDFDICDAGLHSIEITAACNIKSDLAVAIDEICFREILPYKNVELFTNPAAWRGNKLRGKKQTNIYVLNLGAGKHRLDFVAKNDPDIICWSVRHLPDPKDINFDLNVTADNCERQPFVNIILVDLPLMSLTATMGLQWHSKMKKAGDGDDVKLIVDKQVYTDNNSYWLWKANKFDREKVLVTKKVTPNLDKGLHYVQFIADRQPLFQKLSLNTVINKQGDYRLHVVTKKLDGLWNKLKGFISQLYDEGEEKAFLSVYIPSGIQTEINNNNVELFFDNHRITLGTDEDIREDHIDLDHPWANDGNWFFYGIDTTWKLKPENANWRDDDRWKLAKKDN